MKIDYNNFWNEQSSHSFHPSVRLRNDFIIWILKWLQFKSLIDVWCWDGTLLKFISDNFIDKYFSWIDISDFAIKNNQKLLPNTSFFVQNIWEPFTSDFSTTFDIVICSEVIEHVDNRKQVVLNLSSLVNNNWIIILTTQSWKRYFSDISIWHIKHFDLFELENEFKKYWLLPIVSYKKWWPFYDLQKILYEQFKSSASKIQKWKASLFSKLFFSFTYLLFKTSIKSKTLWPQIFLVLKKI